MQAEYCLVARRIRWKREFLVGEYPKIYPLTQLLKDLRVLLRKGPLNVHTLDDVKKILENVVSTYFDDDEVKIENDSFVVLKKL